MSETARCLGLPSEITWRGRRLAVSRVTLGIEARFEEWLTARARAIVDRQAVDLGPAWEAVAKVYQLDYEQGTFCWSSDLARALSGTREGFAELSYHCLARLQPWTREEHAALLADPPQLQALAVEIRRVSDPWPAWAKRPMAGAGATLTTSELFAVLLGEPHHLTVAEIAALDRWQVIGLYFAPRDEKGQVQATGKAPPRVTYREAFFAYWQDRCLADWRIEDAWAKHQAEEKARAAARKQQRRRGR